MYNELEKKEPRLQRSDFLLQKYIFNIFKKIESSQNEIVYNETTFNTR